MWNLKDINRKEYTIITGERRQYPFKLPSDILLPVAWTDFANLSALPHNMNSSIVPDQLYADDWSQKNRHRDVFCRSLICIGAPEVNFASMEVNSLSLFRFLVDDKAQNDLINLFDSLRDKPFIDKAKFLSDKQKELTVIVERLCPISIFDPFADSLQRLDRVTRYQHGLISITSHPYGLKEPCILAGGITGPATSGAVKLLAGYPIFDPGQKVFAGLETRPLGGVFRRKAPTNQRPDDVLHIEEDLEWVTPPYTLTRIRDRLTKIKSFPKLSEIHITKDDIDRLTDLIDSVSGKSLLRQTHKKVHVIILTGGMGTRMAAFTKGRSKAELPIPVRTPQGKMKRDTVLSMLVQSLAKTSIIQDILLLSSDKFIESHKKIGDQLAQRHTVNVTVESDGGDGKINIIKLLAKQLKGYSTKKDPIVLMVCDTLFSSNDLKRFFNWLNSERPILAIGCSQAQGELHRYGVVELDREGVIHRILEKPGTTMQRIINSGIYAFSPELNWNQLLQNAKATNLVELANFLSDKVIIRSFMLADQSYDCGSPDGYKKALEHAEKGKLW